MMKQLTRGDSYVIFQAQGQFMSEVERVRAMVEQALAEARTRGAGDDSRSEPFHLLGLLRAALRSASR